VCVCGVRGHRYHTFWCCINSKRPPCSSFFKKEREGKHRDRKGERGGERERRKSEGDLEFV